MVEITYKDAGLLMKSSGMKKKGEKHINGTFLLWLMVTI